MFPECLSACMTEWRGTVEKELTLNQNVACPAIRQSWDLLTPRMFFHALAQYQEPMFLCFYIDEIKCISPISKEQQD